MAAYNREKKQEETQVPLTKTLSPKTLQQTHAYGPTAVLGGGRLLMSEVSL